MSFRSLYLGGIAVLFLSGLPGEADAIFVGSLSYDTFIPASNGIPGIDAIDVANLTGAFNLAPDFPVASSVTFMDAALVLTLADSSTEAFQLGDIGPGFLADQNGNPLVQLSSTQELAAAELTATLSPRTFSLADGTSYTAASTAVDVLLLPSIGTTLTADVDQSVISIEAAATSITPEPSPMNLMAAGVLFLWLLRRFALTRRGREL